MKSFTKLYTDLDQAKQPKDKVSILSRYLQAAPSEDAAWATYLLSGKKLKRAVTPAKLRLWASEQADVPSWLVDACYKAVDDLSETLALLLSDAMRTNDQPLRWWIEQRLAPLSAMDDTEQRAAMHDAWLALSCPERVIWNKLVTGTFHSSASADVVAQALSAIYDAPKEAITNRLCLPWEVTLEGFRLLTKQGTDMPSSERAVVDHVEEPPAAPHPIPPNNVYSANVVLIYAESARRRGSDLPEYTFGVWSGGELVPAAKTTLKLKTADQRRVERFIRENTLQRFGPVRTIAPMLVFEMQFSGVSLSSRHKSRLVLSTPRITSLLTDVAAERADTVEKLKELVVISPTQAMASTL